MSASIGRVLSDLTHAAVGRLSLIRNAKAILSVRPLATSSHSSAKSGDDSEVKSEPIKFSSSKASNRIWRVDRSMGSNYQRPWWKVLPLSLLCAGFLLWCGLREETDIDRKLEQQLLKHLPGLLSDEEEEEQSESRD